MSKIIRKILFSIILIILAFRNNKADDKLNQLTLKTVADIKLTSPAVAQTNKLSSLKQIKKPNLLKSVALTTMLATAGIMAGHNFHNNLMERNVGTAGHNKSSKISINNRGLTERIRGKDENLKNAQIISSKTNVAEGNLYGKRNWPSQIDKENMAKIGVAWSEHVKNLRKMDEMERKEWNHFDGISENLNVGDDDHKESNKEKENKNAIGLMNKMNKIKNVGLNSAKKLTNYLKEKLINPNQIDIEIGANIGKEMTENMIKICEIMKKILEIDVNMKIDSTENENGKNDGIGMHLKLHNEQTGALDNRQIGSSFILDKHGKMEINPVELGKQIIRQICGGNECDQPDDLPKFGANPCSAKRPPELHELDRSLRPMLLKLGSKLNTGRLWTDNPMPDYRNGFYVAFDWEVESDVTSFDSGWIPLLKAQLERFERNAPIRFLELRNNTMGSSKFKNRLHFVIYDGKNWAESDGLKRNAEKNFVYLNAKRLEECSHLIQNTLLEALGVNTGKGLRTEYDRRDKHMPSLRRAFAQLNAAYGAENYSIQGQPDYLIENNFRIHDKPEVQFWMGQEYANFVSRKYEIPVVYDESFKEMAKQNKKLFDEVYTEFAKNSAIKFVVHEQAPKNKNYVRIYRADNDDTALAWVGHVTELGPSYQGEPVEFGKNRLVKHTIYHELMHAAGMEHEHQRADVEQFLGVDRQKAQKMFSWNDRAYAMNLMPILIYLPRHEYNPRSIMHYDMNYEFFQPKSEKALQQKNQELPNEPDQMDWENLNHFYGVGKGRTQFKVEIDENGQQKIVDDIDGMRRLKK